MKNCLKKSKLKLSIFFLGTLAFSCKDRKFNTTETKNTDVVDSSFDNNKSKIDFDMSKGEFEIPAVTENQLQICSYNIQFLGSSLKRDANFIADALKNCDIVVVQELVAFPYRYVYPESVSWEEFKKPTDPSRDIDDGDFESARFFAEMKKNNFAYTLSSENTGASQFHASSTGNEWWVTFFKLDKIKVAADLPKGFLEERRFNSINFDRVPWALPLRIKKTGADFTLISVHLHFTSKPKDKEEDRRKIVTQGRISDSSELTQGEVDRLLRLTELEQIYGWIEKNKKYTDSNSKIHTEKDYIVLGDMNISGANEVAEIMKVVPNVRTLNPSAEIMTNSQGNEPYDHVMVSNDSNFKYPEKFKLLNMACRAALLGAPEFDPETKKPPEQSSANLKPKNTQCAQFEKVEGRKNFPILKLLDISSKGFWNEFRYRYSDHNPVFFTLDIPEKDDD